MAEAVLRAGRLPELAKYEILEEIGHGGMATVYRAHDRRLERDVAVKVIHPHLRDSPEVVSRFNAEAKAVAKLRHRNIVEVYDVSAPEDADLYLVVELVRGTTLRKLLEKRRALPPEIAGALAIELLGALAHANAAGVVHRDIKPENVLIEHALPPEELADHGRPSVGSRVMVKLTDFGIAKLLDAHGVTSTGQVLGSPAHMAPEQIEGGTSMGARTSSASACSFTSVWSGTCHSTGRTPRRFCGACSTARIPRRRANAPSSARRGARCSIALSPTRRKIASRTPGS
jgi:serine/threonine-protein kinase